MTMFILFLSFQVDFSKVLYLLSTLGNFKLCLYIFVFRSSSAIEMSSQMSISYTIKILTIF